MKLPARFTRLMLNGFPPLFFNRIAITYLSADYQQMEVLVRKSLFNKNLQGTIFGGTIFSAADPYHAILYWQLMAHRGLATEAWLKSAEIDYHRPGHTHLRLRFAVTEAEVHEAERALKTEGRFQKWHEVQALDAQGQPCATIRTLVYLRLRNLQQVKTPEPAQAIP
ncbi:Acyl-coenzyme A thioesterase PaaI, contains HGG motif [Catalinimonas alkaloidigena]|uniref:Acyl-coenzyme A thioesterase PaaI, contains HGG motif n=1 Tax=Catalinimonas alkaloidigena TaxID=1075417 RepID=A0A1G8X5Y6_9BACT|nr:YiiD C-terminal domain-containing protein [Catalinimonas alkaloidigena]SDJ85170.1 Acyl-coenzyme A thioesterase PaaI, contains HGG motif [Catalinimonas alkaloidigena]